MTSEPVRLRVVMPVHNGMPHLVEALESVISALPRAAELVVVDDGSADGSSEFIAGLCRRDSRVRLLRHDQAGGISRALNAGIAVEGSPEFIAVAEHDDVTLPARFIDQLAALDADPRLGAVSGHGRYLGPEGRVVGLVAAGPTTREQFIELRREGIEVLISHPAVTYRSAALDDCGPYDPEFDGAQDLELFNRMVYATGWELRAIPRQHFHYRIHATATSFARMAEQRLMTRYVRYRNAQQLQGQHFSSYTEWLEANRPDPRTARQWRRYDSGALHYRQAGLDWLCRRPVGFARHLVLAVVLHPRWVWAKVRNTMRRGR